MTGISPADLALRLGLKKYPRSWRGDCPSCGYDRAFSVRAGRDQRVQLYCINGCRRDEVSDAVRRIIGGTWTPPDQANSDDAAEMQARKQAIALKLWNGSEHAAGTPADVYLQSRSLPGLARSDVFRFRPDCWHPEAGKLPAMIALVSSAFGTPAAVHRTYLRHNGTGKANIVPAKATLGPCWGGAVRIDPAAEEMVIGEGVESSASAGRLLGLPAWAAMFAGNLAKGLVLPPEVRSVIIAADNDPPAKAGVRAGQDASKAAAQRWRAEGRRVRIALPDRVGEDFNDVLKERPRG